MIDPLAGPGQARTLDPETSHAAAQLVAASATSARVRLLEAHALYLGLGLTDIEACRVAGLSTRSEYATRCSELTRMGMLDRTAEVRLDRTDRPTMPRLVRVITRAGVEVLDRRRRDAIRLLGAADEG